MDTPPRPLNKIAAEILTVWKNEPPGGNVMRFSLPYVRAMLDLQTCNDQYGLEYGDMIVAYALNNMNYWRGVDARRIKAEMKQHLESFNVERHR